MKMKIIHVLCEGQTEQGFVNNVLKPYLIAKGIAAVKSVLVCTSRKANACGGLVSFPKVENDLNIMMKSDEDNDSERHIFTTMFDLYALPGDFPAYADAQHIIDRYERVAAMEKAFSDSIGSDRFIPYIQLHEFEALVLCGLDFLKKMYVGCDKQIEQLKSELNKVGNPELVNDGPDTAPSKRIIKAIEGGKKKRYSYDKPKSGKYVTQNVGIDKLCEQCRHFNEWVGKLLSV